MLFIFDMDDVLYDYDWRKRMSGLADITGIPAERIRELWWHGEGEWAAEAGAFADGDAYLAAFCAAIGHTITKEEWLRLRGGAMTAVPGSIAAVRRAAELGQVTLLTNNGVLLEENLHTLAPALVDVFGEHLLSSSAYGARKPNPVVFERVLERYGVAASDAFFADDLADNVAAAESVGITGHLFTTPEKLLAGIEAFAA